MNFKPMRFMQIAVVFTVVGFIATRLFGDELHDILQNLPDAGFGFLSYVENSTPFNANAKSSGARNVHDSLPAGTEVFIKSLDQNQKQAYFTVRNVKGKPVVLLENIDPQKDPESKARATFTVHRRLSYDLSDWVGFSHAGAGGLFFAVDSESGDVALTNKEQEFKQEDFAQSHWKIIGDSIGNAHIQSRMNGGCLHFFKGKKNVIVKPEERKPNNDVWTVSGDYSMQRRKNENNVPIKYGTKVVAWSQRINRSIFQVILRDANGGQPDQAIRYGDTITLYGIGNAKWLSAGWGWVTDWWALESVRQRWIIQDHLHGFGSGEVCYGKTITLKMASAPFYIEVRPNGALMHGDRRPAEEHLRFLNPEGNIAGVWLDSYDKVYKSASVSNLNVPGGTDFANTVKQNVSTGSVILTQLALKDTNDSWAIDKDNVLYHFDGKEWRREGDRKAKSVSISGEGHVWYVVDDVANQLAIMHGIPDKAKKRIVSWLSVKAEETGANAFVSQAAAYKDGCYFILGNNSKGGMVYFYNGMWEDTKFPNADKDPAVSISAAPDGTVWAVSKNGNLFGYDSTTPDKKWRSYTLPSGALLQQVAAKNKNDVWVVDRAKRGLYHLSDETAWTKQDKCGVVDYVACAVGYTVNPAVKENRHVEVASTKDALDKIIPTDASSAHVSLEISKLGEGGGILPRSGVAFNLLPLVNKPHVTGFTSQEFADLNPKNFLKVNTLLSIGTAWLNTAMKKPGKCLVSFLARAKNQGDIQVVFGQSPNDSFVWRIAFGAQNNQGSTITRRTYKDGAAIDDIVFRVIAKQNPHAAIVPGEWQAYWVSIDDGLILAGAGNPGDNIFMAWRDPHPPADVNCIGFGSHKQDVEYTQITRSDETINAQPVTRVYKKFPAVKTNANILFRVQEEGAIGFMTVDGNPISLTLSPEEQSFDGHYSVNFNSSDGISILKFNAVTKKYETCASLTSKLFPDINFSAEPRTFWVCYDEGYLFVGDNDIAQKESEPRVLLVFQDPKPIKGIRVVKVAEGNVRNVSIAPPVLLASGRKKVGYQLLAKALPFSGGVTIVFPFDYQFSQNRQQVFIENLVAMTGPRSVAAIPQQGAHYNFRFSIGEHGEPGMVLMEAPKNPYREAFDRAVIKAEARQQYLIAQGELEAQQGTIDKAKIDAAAAQFRAGSATAKDIGQQLVKAGTELMGKGGAVGAVVGGIATGAGVASIGASAALDQVAAAKDYEGAIAAAAGQERELRKKQEAAELKFKTDVGKGSAETAFRAHDSYVFVENVSAPKLASADIPEEAKQNKEALIGILQQVMVSEPTLDQVQTMVSLITHYHVISNVANKKQLQSVINKLCAREQDNVAAYNDMINILFAAYNNAFLTDESIPQEANLRAEWLTQINRFARKLLENKEKPFVINSYFGEYVWLPVAMPATGNALFTFSVLGRSDLFVCFAPSYGTRIRNSHKELYELVIGGWDGSKSALRLESLGHSVLEVGSDENPHATLDSLEHTSFWINISKGRITAGRGTPGANKFLDWIDPYPCKVQYIGVSSWDSRVEIKDWKILPALDFAQDVPLKLKKKRSLARGLGVTKKSLTGEAVAEGEATDEEEIAAIETESEDVQLEGDEVVADAAGQSAAGDLAEEKGMEEEPVSSDVASSEEPAENREVAVED